MPIVLWILVTLTSSGAQTLRNATQRELIWALGAAQVLSLFGLPFAVLLFFGLLAATGDHAPAARPRPFRWTAFGGFAQIVATALMQAAMRNRGFVVAAGILVWASG